MIDKDLELYCLIGKPFYVEEFGYIHCPTIGEVLDIGYSEYNKMLSLLCISDDEVRNILNSEEQSISAFEFLYFSCFTGEESFKCQILDALQFFFKKEIHLGEESCCFFIGDKENNKKLHKLNYMHFTDILKFQNAINDSENEIKIESKNSKVEEYLRKLKKAKKEYDKKFNDTKISDIISAVCARHPSINLLNVISLTTYQVVDQYRRLTMVDDYFITIESLMHGASSSDENEKIEPLHWSSTYLEKVEHKA